MAWRALAPAPVEIAMGKTPRMKANEVMRIGRKRSRAASSTAWCSVRPSRCSVTANSDRKSTRLNSSHLVTSYAVFCLKKKNFFQSYLNIYNNYFKAQWKPDRTEANTNDLNQNDAHYGFHCCHLKNIWTAPLHPEIELSRQMTTSTTSIDIIGLQAAYANLHTDQFFY